MLWALTEKSGREIASNKFEFYFHQRITAHWLTFVRFVARSRELSILKCR